MLFWRLLRKRKKKRRRKVKLDLVISFQYVQAEQLLAAKK